LLTVSEGECEWRWVAPGLPIPAEAEKGTAVPL